MDEARTAWDAGSKYVLHVLSTGGGKTVLLADAVAGAGGPSCTIVHRQELLGQISNTYAKAGIAHNIIAPQPVINSIIQGHVEKFGRSFYNPSSVATIASVDTIIRRFKPGDRWCKTVVLWLCDECFPAGTMVGDRKIEDLRTGDVVESFNEHTGRLEKGVVTHLFKSPAPDTMVRIKSGNRTIVSTANHPFWTKRGWVNASEIQKDDHVLHTKPNALPHLRGDSFKRSSDDAAVRTNGQGVLLQDVFESVSVKNIIGDNGTDQPETRIGTNETEQPDAVAGSACENESNAEGNGTCAVCQGREWATCDCGGTEVEQHVRANGVQTSNDCADWREGSGDRLPDTLQDRLRSCASQDSDRSGRFQSCGTVTTRAGRTEGLILEWHGVDSIEVLKSDDTGIAGDGFVYNIEVSGNHTYTANGFVVHNCHHALGVTADPANKWGKACRLFPNARGLGVTATPLRADNRSLHVDQGGAFDTLVQGPSMSDLIKSGDLCAYRVLAPEPSINEALLKIGGSGEFTDKSVKAATKAEMTGNIVETYLQHTPGKQAIVFTTGKAQSHELAAAFIAACVAAKALDSDTPDQERTQAVKDFGAGQLQVLINTGLFDEGFDVPAVEVVIMGRPTMSFGLFCQQIGRCLRPAPGKAFGIVIDHVGNVIRMASTHGLPDTPRKWELWRDPKQRGVAKNPDAIPVRTCAGCSLQYEAIRMICPFCQHEHTPAGRDAPEQVDGILAEMSPELLERLRMQKAQVWRDSPAIPLGASEMVAKGIENRHRHAQQAHVMLAEAMALWGGQRKAAGDDDTAMQARFMHRFGVDVMTAQTLPRSKAIELMEEIRGALL